MAAPIPPKANIMQVNSILSESSPTKYNPTVPTTQNAEPQSDKPAAPARVASSSFTPVNPSRPVQTQTLPSPYQTPYQPATQTPPRAIPPIQTISPVQAIPHVQAIPSVNAIPPVQPSSSTRPPVEIQPATAPAAQPIEPAPSTMAITPRSAMSNMSAHEYYYAENHAHEAAQTAAGIPPNPFRQIEWDDVEDMEPDMSPQLVRNKLNALFDVEKYGKGKFCEEAGTTNKSLNTFMKMSGSNGRQTSAYGAGWKFFKLRQMREKDAKETDKKAQPKKRKSTGGGEEGAPAAKTTKTTAGKSAAQPHVDISDIHLPGEETDSVEVYGTALLPLSDAHLTS